MSHKAEFRVYWEDTDGGGVVYYANYLKFAERARTEILRKHGIAQSVMLAEHGVAIVVRHAEIDFLAPAKLDDLLTINTRVDDIGKVSVTMHQIISREATPLCEITVRLGIVGPDFRLARMPDFLHEALTAAP